MPSIAIYMHDLSGGGAERQVLTLAQELINLGVQVTLVVHSTDGALRDSLPAGLTVHNLASPRTLADIPRLARYLRQQRPDILMANVDHNNVAGLLAKVASGTSTRVIICQHNALSAEFAKQSGRWTYRLIGQAYRALSPWISAAVAVSGGIAEELVTNAHLPAHKVRIIHNAIIGADFQYRANEEVSHPWFDEPGRVFVTAGRLVPPKDHATLLKAFALHRVKHSSRLIILGDGPLRDGLETLAHALNLSGAVDFVGFQPNPLPYFRHADCFVLSSSSEGFGNVLVEAMGCGTPVISTDCPHGPAEILEKGRYGTLVRPTDPTALSVAMDQVESMRARWSPEILIMRAAEFSNGACAMKYVGLFNAVLTSVQSQTSSSSKQHQITPG